VSFLAARQARHLEKVFLLILFIAFTAFTWRGILFFFSGDDMMNMWKAWTVNPWRLGRALVVPWDPVYRPLGGAVYRVFYRIFGFHPLPLYTSCWLVLAANFFLAWRFFRAVSLPPAAALTALALTFVHGRFTDLYISAGTIYDRLVFFFTLLPLCLYADTRRAGSSRISFWRGTAIWIFCFAAMDSKESGIVVPVLLLLYEGIFVAPAVIRQVGWRGWLRLLIPLSVALAALGTAFVFGRVQRTPDLVMTPDYHAKLTVSIWLDRLSHYFTTLSYDRITFNSTITAILLGVTFLVSIAAFRIGRKLMLYGWLFFVVSILPVAAIAPRLGYVLYVPLVGIGIWLADAVDWTLPDRANWFAAAVIAIASIWFHAHYWTRFPDPRGNPEARLTEQFRREYSHFNPYTKLLFASDDFPEPAFDLKFNLELLYGVPLEVRRMHAPRDQQPVPGKPLQFDRIFAAEDGHYVELDNRNPEESLRLHILRNYQAGRHMNILNRDHGAYVVSGVVDGESDNGGRWTNEKATLKFDIYPADAKLTIRYFVADVIVAQHETLTVSVNGNEAGKVALDSPGSKESSFAIPARWISRYGYTLVDLTVSNPYRDVTGQLLGVVLTSADFDYRQ
jgi:hypothetical protein